MEDSKELLVSKCLCRWQTLEADYKDKYSTAFTDRPLWKRRFWQVASEEWDENEIDWVEKFRKRKWRLFSVQL